MIRNLVAGSSILLVFLHPVFSYGLTTIKQVEVKSGRSIELSIDGKIEQNQIQTDYLNDIIQVSLTGTSIYPAKMLPINEGIISKVFVYQYSPQLVRCRVSVKGKADEYKNLTQIEVSPKGLRIHVGEQAAAVEEKVQSPSTALVEAETTLDEEALVKKLLKQNSSPAQKGVKQELLGEDDLLASEKRSSRVTSASSSAQHHARLPASEEEGLTGGGHALPTMSSVFLKLLAVIGLFAIAALLFKKLRGGGQGLAAAEESGGWLSHLKRAASQGTGFDKKMIQVVSTHSLGIKKSLMVVRVASKTLVIGVTSDSINLITDLSEGRGASASTDEFSSVLANERMKPHEESLAPRPASSSDAGVRSRIKNRLEGLKPL